MKCRTAERDLLRSLDRTPDPAERRELDRHLQSCPRCRVLSAEYAAIQSALRGRPEGRPRPYFWERLNARIEALERPATAVLWRKWCLRAIPVSLFLLGLFLGGLMFFPGGDENLSQSEALLLRNSNPLTETRTYLDENKNVDKSMMIIFAAERAPERKPWP